MFLKVHRATHLNHQNFALVFTLNLMANIAMADHLQPAIELWKRSNKEIWEEFQALPDMVKDPSDATEHAFFHPEDKNILIEEGKTCFEKGIHQNKTFAEVIHQHPEFVKWSIENRQKAGKATTQTMFLHFIGKSLLYGFKVPPDTDNSTATEHASPPNPSPYLNPSPFKSPPPNPSPGMSLQTRMMEIMVSVTQVVSKVETMEAALKVTTQQYKVDKEQLLRLQDSVRHQQNQITGLKAQNQEMANQITSLSQRLNELEKK